MLANMANVTGQGYATAFDKAMQQFNTEQQEGITADRLQFEEERDFPYKQVQYMQSLLQGLPIAAQSYSYAAPSQLSEFLSGSGGVYDLLSKVFLPSDSGSSNSGETTANGEAE